MAARQYPKATATVTTATIAEPNKEQTAGDPNNPKSPANNPVTQPPTTPPKPKSHKNPRRRGKPIGKGKISRVARKRLERAF